jgi:hypothetical protein
VNIESICYVTLTIAAILATANNYILFRARVKKIRQSRQILKKLQTQKNKKNKENVPL